VLIYHEDEWWIAHCLEMDLPAEGQSPQEAFQNLLDVLDVQIQSSLADGDLGSIFSPAPAELWRMYALATDRTFRKKPPKPVSRLDVRELVLA
jgi:hypothetical protein